MAILIPVPKFRNAYFLFLSSIMLFASTSSTAPHSFAAAAAASTTNTVSAAPAATTTSTTASAVTSAQPAASVASSASRKLLLGSATAAPPSATTMEEAIACCNGTNRTPVVMRNHTDLESFLVMVQSAALQVEGDKDFDPKVYVDLPLKNPLHSTEAAFVDLWRNSNTNGTVESGEFNRFINEFFDKPGSDLLPDNLTDFKNDPEGFLVNVKNPEAREFALKMHSLWWLLARKVKDRVRRDPQQHTLLPLPFPVVVPGARFREVYYWDTYWIVRGLLVSKLYETAKSVLGNLIFLADSFGFIPNGARTYYTNRSQPPLLSEAVKAVYEETQDMAFVEKAFPALLKEHSFWSSDPHRVQIRDEHGTEHVLTRFYAMWDEPRPESSTIDIHIARGLDRKAKAELYHHIATAAETGWDFSSRWMADRQNLSTLKTSYILPVDLNGFLVQMEHNLAYFSKLLGKTDYEQHFTGVAHSRRAAMDAILWNEEMGQYLDYWLVRRDDTVGMANMNYRDFEVVYDFNKENQNEDIFPSNFIPLWCNMLQPEDKKVAKLIKSFKKSGLMLDAGVSTSLLTTGQQWDYPNAWAPLQHMMIEGMAATKCDEGIALAKEMSRRWLETNYVGFINTGEMQEKYDGRFCGKTGEGGEYTPQAGFGWSNGVVLCLFDMFGWPEDVKFECPPL